MARTPIAALANGTSLTLTTAPQAVLPLVAPQSQIQVTVVEHGLTTQLTVYAEEFGTDVLTQPVSTTSSGQVPGYLDIDTIAVTGADLILALPGGPQTVVLSAPGIIGAPGDPGLLLVEVPGGNMGMASTLTLEAGKRTRFTGTLTTDCVLTIAGTGGADALLYVAQDGAGGHALSVSDGTTTVAVTIPTAANSLAILLLERASNGDLYVSTVSVPGPQGNPGSTGSAGAPGAAATVAVGTVTTGAPGSAALVTNVGSSSAAILNFVLPQGAGSGLFLTGGDASTSFPTSVLSGGASV